MRYGAGTGAGWPDSGDLATTTCLCLRQSVTGRRLRVAETSAADKHPDGQTDRPARVAGWTARSLCAPCGRLAAETPAMKLRSSAVPDRRRSDLSGAPESFRLVNSCEPATSDLFETTSSIIGWQVTYAQQQQQRLPSTLSPS